MKPEEETELLSFSQLETFNLSNQVSNKKKKLFDSNFRLHFKKIKGKNNQVILTEL